MKNHYALGILFSGSLFACGDGTQTPVWSGTIDTLESGIVRVSNPAEALFGSTALPLVQETRIGAVEGGGPDIFGAVVGLEVDRFGRIYVLDRQAQELRVFETDGRFVRTIGRTGEGPGEFRSANGMGWAAPDTLWVVDKELGRFNVFDTTGVSVATYRSRTTSYSWSWRGGFSADGDLYDYGVDVNDPDYLASPPGTRDPPQILLRFDRTLGQFADTFPAPVFDFEPQMFTWTFSGGGRRIMGIPHAPRPMWRLSPDAHVWAGVSGQYRIHQLTLTGDTLRIIEREHTPIGVSPSEREEALKGVREAADGGPFDESRIPTVKPAFERFEVDHDGFLWVQLPYDAVEGITAFDIFDPEGRYLSQVSTPYRVYQYAPFVIRRDRLYFVAVDEFDVPYVLVTALPGSLRDSKRLPLPNADAF